MSKLSQLARLEALEQKRSYVSNASLLDRKLPLDFLLRHGMDGAAEYADKYPSHSRLAQQFFALLFAKKAG